MKQEGTTMKTFARLTIMGVAALVTVHIAWAGPPTEQLREGVDRVIKTLRDPELRGDKKTSERRAAISKLADEIFDFTETAKRALGQHWAPRTPAEREDFVRLFTGLVQRTYIAKVDQYNSDMSFRGDSVEGIRPSCGRRSPLDKGAACRSTTGCTDHKTAGWCTTSTSMGSASWQTTGPNSTGSCGPNRTKPWW
jgi:MlaC protein